MSLYEYAHASNLSFCSPFRGLPDSALTRTCV